MKRLRTRRIGERSRPGCSSVRPRAELGRARLNGLVSTSYLFRRPVWARFAAPEAGALPETTPSHPDADGALWLWFEPPHVGSYEDLKP
jgi:hypothetical protein